MTKKPDAPRPKPKQIKDLPVEMVGLPPTQSSLFHVERQIEFQDVEMGVLESGVPYLTGRGLAKMCGIDHKTLHEMAADWGSQRLKPRGKVIDQLLEQSSYFEDSLYLKAEFNGTEVNAYTEPVCLAILEYYAFLADERKEQATRAFRVLARTKFREFVYDAVGYQPEHAVLDKWKHFHDRVDLTQDAAPVGYWGVFREISIMIVPMIRAGVLISDKVVPDISVGRAWSDHWTTNNLASAHGERVRYDHAYPDYYPQAKSNPQPAFAYPNSALGVFRDWLATHYILNKFPKYLLGQTSKGSVPITLANQALGAFGATKIENKPKRIAK